MVVHRRAGTDSGGVSDAAPPDADILIARDLGVALAVQTADCVPILIADRKSAAVAAVHAGGAASPSAPIAAVEALTREFGARPEDLIAAVGPSIGAARYEVDAAVLSRFEQNGFSAEHIGRWLCDGERL